MTLAHQGVEFIPAENTGESVCCLAAGSNWYVVVVKHPYHGGGYGTALDHLDGRRTSHQENGNAVRAEEIFHFFFGAGSVSPVFPLYSSDSTCTLSGGVVSASASASCPLPSLAAAYFLLMGSEG